MITFELDNDKVTDGQMGKLVKMLALAAHSHYASIIVRHNGKDVFCEGNWLKHLRVIDPGTAPRSGMEQGGSMLAQMANDGAYECATNPETAMLVTDVMNELMGEIDDARRVAALLMAAASLALKMPPPETPATEN